VAKKRTTKPRKSLNAPRYPSKSDKLNAKIPVEDYEHSEAKRTNNPPAGLAHLDREDTPTKTLEYDPHLDPQMVWAGKAERASVNVPAPSVHVHEELSAQKIVGSVRRQRAQQPLFDVGELDPAKAVEFYQHDMSWSNRMILGDSLVVMTSLLERERMGGQVQCVFIDPPYGVKYNSNFQPRIGDTEVTDRRDDDLTREPEMIQAYRDTWELGVHSYLTYLRDRFTVARELLADSGSVFVQISSENVHRVRVLLDEVFGGDNFVAEIVYQKTTGAGSPNDVLTSLPSVFDYVVWYARDKEQMKYRQLYLDKEVGGQGASLYTQVELKDGTIRPLTAEEKSGVALPEGARAFGLDNLTSSSGVDKTRYAVTVEGVEYRPTGSRVWATSEEGMNRLIAAGRVRSTSGKNLGYVRYIDDFPGYPLSNIWTDTVGQNQFGGEKRYVVQTALKAIQRCLLMTTDPGDLVLDPTCGSGATALVAEQWGRRWVTIDTSRVAMSIARERLLTYVFPYYELLDKSRDVDGGFKYKIVKRVMLQTVARGEQPVETVMIDQPIVAKGKTRVSGPFTVEALSRYATNPSDGAPSAGPAVEDAFAHVETLLDALRTQGIPRPGAKPAKIENMTPMSGGGLLQAEGVLDRDGKKVRFAVSLGPRFGAITMAQVSDALQDAIGFGLVVFAGFAVASDAQAQLATGKVGGVDVALLLVNPDLLAGDLLKNTSSSQTFRLYASPDVRMERDGGGWRATVEGVDSFDASTGDVTSYGRSGVQAWFLDDAYDGKVFRVSQAFFPVTNGWEKLSNALKGTVDAELVEELHSWTSLPFDTPETGRIAVRVVTDDGNASEVILSVDAATGRK
jgi:adenine-specific DNA-methyltransferase